MNDARKESRMCFVRHVNVRDDVAFVRAKFRKVTKIRNLSRDHDVGM